MIANQKIFTLEKYSTFSFVAIMPTGTDLTGYTAKMHIRADIADTSPLIELSTENGRIIIDGPNGTITPNITDEDTATLPGEIKAVYDLVITSPAGEALRIIEGTIYIKEGVTK